MSVYLMIGAVLTLGAAGYVHLNLRHFIATASGLVTAHGVLLAVGLGLGYAGAAAVEPELKWAASLIGFGIVHVPAAFVLMLKRVRHAPRT